MNFLPASVWFLGIATIHCQYKLEARLSSAIALIGLILFILLGIYQTERTK